MSNKIKLGKTAAKNKFKLFTSAMDLPNDPFAKSARITLIGNKEAVIDGCSGIIEYSDCLVKIGIGNKVLEFAGANFNIADYSSTSITLKGNIQALNFGG